MVLYLFCLIKSEWRRGKGISHGRAERPPLFSLFNHKHSDKEKGEQQRLEGDIPVHGVTIHYPLSCYPSELLRFSPPMGHNHWRVIERIANDIAFQMEHVLNHRCVNNFGRRSLRIDGAVLDGSNMIGVPAG